MTFLLASTSFEGRFQASYVFPLDQDYDYVYDYDYVHESLTLLTERLSRETNKPTKKISPMLNLTAILAPCAESEKYN